MQKRQITVNLNVAGLNGLTLGLHPSILKFEIAFTTFTNLFRD